MSYTYIVRCSDGTLYTGWTSDLKRRVAAHNTGAGAKYTRSRLPVRLVYFEEYEDKRQAQKREYAIKRMPREAKEALIGERLLYFEYGGDATDYLIFSLWLSRQSLSLGNRGRRNSRNTGLCTRKAEK